MRLWLRQFTRRRYRQEFRYLETSGQFHRTLERERMRADRNRAVFSLIEFEFDPCVQFSRHARRLERILEGRLRSTDVIGLVSKNLIGVLLPDTPDPGARIVVRDVTGLWGPADVRLLSKISIYSSEDWIDRRAFDDEGEYRHAHRNGRTNRGTHSVPTAAIAQSGAVLSEALIFSQPLPTWKRAFDIFGAGAGFVLLAPLFLMVTALIWLTSGRPIFFRQLRSGLGRRPFWIYKFRTMCPDAEHRKAALREMSEQDGPAFKLKSDPRVTRVGRYLRKSSIDELPQFWNVLKGEMTLVGPRPLPCDESDGCESWHLRRLDVTPGLTCIWQIEGKSQVPFAEWMRMDIRYMKQRTPWHDLKLIIRTAFAVVAHRASH